MKLIEGRYYETVSGVVVGPMVEHGKGTKMPHFTSYGGELNAINMDGFEIGYKQRWNEDGSIRAGVASESGHVIVREVPAPSSVETLTIKIDAKEAQEIIAEAAKEFDASAHKLLSDMAGVQAELRAAKDAFNVLHFEKEQLAFRVGNQKDTIRRRGAEIQRLDEEIAMKDAFLAEKDSRLKRSLDLVKSANSRNIALGKKNEALGLEVLRLSEARHEWAEAFGLVSVRKLKGDDRLRRDRAKLKAERARSAELEERAKDAEEQLRMYNSGKVVARNAAILLGLIATALAFGGFFF